MEPKQKEKRTSKKSNPWTILFYAWVALSTFTNVVALASLAEGLIAWSDFVVNLVESYKQIRSYVWGNLFDVLGINLPDWSQDYLTTNSLVAVSIVWAVFNASRSISSPALSSPFRYFRNNILDFSIGGSVLDSFSEKVTKEAHQSSLEINTEQVEYLTKISKRIVSPFSVLKGLVILSISLISYFLCAFPFPWILNLNDWWDARLTKIEYARVRSQLASFGFPQSLKEITLSKFDEATGFQAAFVAMNQEFHATLRKSLISYLIVVFTLFILLIFLNQILNVLFGAG